MKIFLSWSGQRSKAAAEALGNWTARIIQAVDPWISSAMDKGTRWQSEIADHLEEAKVGIVCLTASNLSEPWILFEAGALSKTKGSYVCTFLLDIGAADVEPPLGQFQHTTFEKEQVFKLMQTINRCVEANAERGLTEANLETMFETFWPRLESDLRQAMTREEGEIVRRPDRQLLEEVLEILRAQEQRAQKKPSPGLVEWKGTSDDVSGVTFFPSNLSAPISDASRITLSAPISLPKAALKEYITILGGEKERQKKTKAPSDSKRGEAKR